jgi:hypothetical protein
MKKIWIVGMMVFLPLSLQAMDDANEEFRMLVEKNPVSKIPKFLRIGLTPLEQDIIPVQEVNLTPKKKVSFSNTDAPISKSVETPKKSVPLRSILKQPAYVEQAQEVQEMELDIDPYVRPENPSSQSSENIKTEIAAHHFSHTRNRFDPSK